MNIYFRKAKEHESYLIQNEMESQGRYTKGWKSGVLILACCSKTHTILGWARHWRTKAERDVVKSVTVKKQYRGEKIGLHLVNYLMKNKANIDKWYLNCMPSLGDYYRGLGYKDKPWSVAPELFDEDDDPEELCLVCQTKDFTPYKKQTHIYIPTVMEKNMRVQ